MDSLHDPDNDRLLDDVQAGHTEAIQTLLDRHRDRLRRMVSIRLSSRLAARVDPSDIVQDTMAEAAARIRDYADNRALAFYPWLRRIAWQHLVNSWRRHIQVERRSVTREVRLDLSASSRQELARHFVSRHSSPSAAAIRQELQARVQAGLDQLPELDRELLILRYLEQLSMREIADVLGISESAARQRHVRALDRLQRHLSPADGEQ